MWKAVEKIMVAQLSVIELHDSLHGGLPCRGTGTAIMEAKLNQQLAWVDQEPLYQIYLDLRKVYDALDWGGASKSWLAMGWGQICHVCRNSSGMTRKWYVALGAIMGSPLEPIEVLRKVDLSPASCSMFVSIA
jgi:hypothetical protein